MLWISCVFSWTRLSPGYNLDHLSLPYLCRRGMWVFCLLLLFILFCFCFCCFIFPTEIIYRATLYPFRVCKMGMKFVPWYWSLNLYFNKYFFIQQLCQFCISENEYQLNFQTRKPFNCMNSVFMLKSICRQLDIFWAHLSRIILESATNRNKVMLLTSFFCLFICR